MRNVLTLSPFRRSLATVAVATMVVTGPAAATVARADDGDQLITSAQAEVSVDGRQVFDDAFRVIEFDDPVVNPGNLAYAHAVGCEGCQAVALSFQIVLVQEPPEQVVPENVALSLNENCNTCVAAAGAYQFVVGGHPVRLTGSGRQQLHRISDQVDALRWSGVTGPEMVAQADALADQVQSVLKAELRSTDENGEGDGKARVDERRVRDNGRDGRSEDSQVYEVDSES